ncbi:MAG: GTPase domain-containing protein [Actinobacteria bacterium]|nr:GTPase domain-containing protein [Thermoleophilia bacterium]MCB9011891.1 GTPase domain-containing protein [Actinomycetota bacterium]
MTTPTSQLDAERLHQAVVGLRDVLRATELPLDVRGAAEAREERDAVVNQLDDYVIPRLAAWDAPLLTVVGGSTGAGKSTLVNSIVGDVVSRAGVLRPTTSAPVLVVNPDDRPWFIDDRVLPGLARATGASDGDQDPNSVRLVEAASLTPGLAILDAPDIDSVVSRNRDLGAQLLAAADMWVFVTTAARYADAVPWDLLATAGARGTSVAVVLDRIPPAAQDEIRRHLASMLAEHRLGDAPVFVVPEVTLDPRGLLPGDRIGPLRDWLLDLASDQQRRAAVVQRTLTGALDALGERVGVVTAGVGEQSEAIAALLTEVQEAYDGAAAGVEQGMSDGTLLRGEVLARWQEYVGTSEVFRQLESALARLRDRISAALTGKPQPARPVGEALQTGAAALIIANAEAAASTAARRWRGHPAGEALLADHPELAAPGGDLEERVQRVVRDWQSMIFDMVRTEGKDKRSTARFMAYGVNGIGVMLMLATFASTGGLTGAEVGIAGGSAALAQKVLEAIFGDQAVRALARRAREDLLERTAELYADERGRFTRAVEALGLPDDQGERLVAALDGVRRAR